MRVLLQRVTAGGVEIDGQSAGRIGHGVVLLVGIGHGDADKTVETMAQKIVSLRVFSDDQKPFHQSLLDVAGGALVIPQFTLYADTRKGRRPCFLDAAPPQQARPLVDRFALKLSDLGVHPVASGRFGAQMAVEIHNQGPVTIWLDSEDWTAR